jgi:capsular polysaccharide biosynthesis protein
MVQRAGDADAPGLFRNVGFNLTEQIVRAIEAGLDGLFDPGRYTFAAPRGWDDYALNCHCYGFQFHTAVPQTESPDKAEASVAALRMLKRLFLETLRDGHKTFVYRHNDAEESTPEHAQRLFDALRRHGPARLLFVSEDTHYTARFGRFEPRPDGLILASMPSLAKENPPIINFPAWESLLRRVIDLRNGDGAVHAGRADQDSPLFSIGWDNLRAGQRITVEAELNIPSDSNASDADLVFWGFPSTGGRPIDPGRRDEWQAASVTAVVPAGSDRAVGALRVDGPATPRVLSRNWHIRSHSARRTYRVVRWRDLPPGAIEATTRHPDIDMPLAPIVFGQTKRPDTPVREYPPGGWEADRIRLGDIASVAVRDAIIHGAEGIVTIGDDIIDETIRLARFGGRHLAWEDRDRVSLEAEPVALSLPAGVHVFYGWPGVHNYAHFLLDMVPSCAAPFSPPWLPLLWPASPFPWQAAYFDLLDLRNRSITVSGTVACSSLHIPALSLIDSGHFPHPLRMPVMADLRSRVGFDADKKRKLYIARKDARSRPLVNEPELIQLLTDRGFEVLELSRMTVPDQIRAFAEAGCIVAQHGAGLANIVFCQPGTALLELHVDSYVQWTIRRLASVARMRYGCVLGSQQDTAWGDPAQPTVGAWIIDLARVLEALDAI